MGRVAQVKAFTAVSIAIRERKGANRDCERLLSRVRGARLPFACEHTRDVILERQRHDTRLAVRPGHPDAQREGRRGGARLRGVRREKRQRLDRGRRKNGRVDLFGTGLPPISGVFERTEKPRRCRRGLPRRSDDDDRAHQRCEHKRDPRRAAVCHKRVLHPGRQRHGIVLSPSVL
jgi:hypothetical protein